MHFALRAYNQDAFCFTSLHARCIGQLRGEIAFNKRAYERGSLRCLHVPARDRARVFDMCLTHACTSKGILAAVPPQTQEPMLSRMVALPKYDAKSKNARAAAKGQPD